MVIRNILLKMNRRLIWLISLAFVMLSACLEPYPPPGNLPPVNILVVDGFMNSTDGSAIVRLSRAVPLSDKDVFRPESNATVTILTADGRTFDLVQQDSGRYSLNGMIIDPALRYQLQIRTEDGQDYFSDFVDIRQSPPIDSVTWRPGIAGLDVLVNSHDDSGNSRYYRWDYTETWEYHAPVQAAYKVINGEVLFRDPEDYLYTCWKTVPSTRILIGSSVRLTEDVIRDFPLIFIPKFSDKISIKYSMLVRQRVMDKMEYQFWSDLQKTTESIGSLFDPQPYEITGNIHSAGDGGAPVLGFFSGGSVREERLFLNYKDLPENLKERPYSFCVLDTVCLFKGPSTPYSCITDIPNLPPNPLLVGGLYDGPTLYGYTLANTRCADCRVYGGGVLTKPAFWP